MKGTGHCQTGINKQMAIVFLSYGREDREAATRLYRNLRRFGYEVWFDQKSLSPGQSWKSSVVSAIRTADAVVVLLSKSSCARRGFVNNEIREALEILKSQPGQKAFLIPARLDECDPSHPDLHELHWVDMFPSWSGGLRQIKKTLDFGKPQGADGVRLRAFILAQIHLVGFGAIASAVREIKNVVSVDMLLGDFDLIAIVEARKQDEVFKTIERIRKVPGIQKTSTYYGIDTARRSPKS